MKKNNMGGVVNAPSKEIKDEIDETLADDLF
jgi:hypothetical protein